jgi:hypothetical protein
MKMATEMTEKQRRAVEALEGARSEGVTLSEYAKGHGLVLRELYDAIAALRRKGMLAKPVRKRASGRFVAVRVAERTPPAMSAASSAPLCRIVQRSCVIECLQWPEPRWLVALMQTPGATDAAS